MHLSYTDDWQDMQFDGSLPVMWRTTFLSKKVLISREELLVLLRTKLQMDPTLSNLQRILKNLHIQCFGTLTTPITPGEPSKRRKLVGIDSTHRRDFVRVRGSENNTALACQVRVYAHECLYTDVLYTHVRDSCQVRVYAPECVYTDILYTCAHRSYTSTCTITPRSSCSSKFPVSMTLTTSPCRGTFVLMQTSQGTVIHYLIQVLIV